jgi:hypothetical protein
MAFIYKILFFMIGFLLCCRPENNLFVDQVNGSDSNNCTSLEQSCKTLRKTIATATDLDTINVYPGNYSEAIIVLNAINLNITSVMGAADTIINTPFNISGSNESFYIFGFTFNSYINISTSNLGIDSCIFSDMTNLTAIYVLANSSLEINNCVFININNSNNSTGAISVGSIIDDCTNCSLNIQNCTFSNNIAQYGSAIFFKSIGSLSIINSTVSFNGAKLTGAIHAERGSVYVSDSLIYGNTGFNGAGISFLFLFKENLFKILK